MLLVELTQPLWLQAGQSQALVDEIAKRPGAKVRKVFESNIFSGVSIETDADNLDTLNAISSVSKAWKSKLVPLNAPTVAQSYSDDAAAVNYSMHGLTGVDRLHAMGIKGKGAVVAVVDTGVDFTHPAVGRSHPGAHR